MLSHGQSGAEMHRSSNILKANHTSLINPVDLTKSPSPPFPPKCVSSCMFRVHRANSEKYYRPILNLQVRYKNTGIQVTIQNSHFVWYDLHKRRVLCHSSACAWTQSGPIQNSSMEKHSNVHTTAFYIWKKSTWEKLPRKEKQVFC